MIERLSKSERKRRFKREEEAAGELALLSDNDLKKLPVDEAVKTEIIHCRKLKGGARKRQVKYLAKVMRDGDVEAVFEFLAEKKGSKLKDTKLHHEAEHLRDLIVNEAIEFQQYCLQNGLDWEPDWPGEEIDEIIKRFDLNAGDLRRTVFQYVKTRIHNHYREVFRTLKAALEKEEMFNKLNKE